MRPFEVRFMRTHAQLQSTILALLATFTLAVTCVGDDPAKNKEGTVSDDAKTTEESFFHANARALVIRNLKLNKLGVGGKEFRVRRNPVGKGCFVYDPRRRFSGVERKLVWWAIDEKTVYAINSPSNMVQFSGNGD